MGSGRRVARQGLIVAVLGAVLLAGIAVPAIGGKADVLKVAIVPNGAGAFDLSVTLRHADSGWDHYANRWEVMAPDGQILAVRTLAHPHVHEQPFTRSLRGVAIPPTMTWIRVRGHDLVHGLGGREVTVSVPHPPR